MANTKKDHNYSKNKKCPDCGKLICNTALRCGSCLGKSRIDLKLNGRWSRKYSHCTKCGMTDKKHYALGLCFHCYRIYEYHKKHPNAGFTGRWARKFDKCVECGTTEIKHESKGLCRRCYQATKRHPRIPKIEIGYCSQCGNEIKRIPSLMKAKNHFCNTICFSKWQKVNMRGEKNHFYGEKHTEETIQKIKDSWTKELRGQVSIKKSGINHPYYGKKFSKDHVEKMCKSHKGYNPWDHIGDPEKTKNKISSTLKKLYENIENHPAWKGGISYEPYTPDFNERFKEAVRARDNYCCLVCNKSQEELGYKLSIHHVDYDKKNSFFQNAASLCKKNHSETNINREHWKKFFQSLLKERYGYEYTEDQKIILDFTKVENGKTI